MSISEVVPFTAGDGMQLNLVHVTGAQRPTKGPVLLVHGAGVRANIFRAPVDTTIVDALLAEGYDVWLENWRASIDLNPNPWTLEQAAVHDHPVAVQTVLANTGADEVKAVIHCQGSTSFAMAAVAGLVPDVSTIVSNAVSLHPVIKPVSELKARYIAPVIRLATPYMDPSWGNGGSGFLPGFFRTLVRLTHHECDNDVCRLASFTYGTGFPLMWSHENLNDATHEWLKQEFAKVPMRFFDQISRCLRAGHLVAVERLPGLPDGFVDEPPKTDARWALLAGEDNLCFLPESQMRTHAWLERHEPERHSLRIIPGYGHLDVWMGKHAAADVFPFVLEELER